CWSWAGARAAEPPQAEGQPSRLSIPRRPRSIGPSWGIGGDHGPERTARNQPCAKRPPRPVMTPEAPFVGRAREVEALREAVRAAESGTGRTAIVEGIAGIGKSRLLQEATGSGLDELLVVRLHGSEVDSHRPFGP